MLSVITSILQYAGLIATTAMAIFSLFYSFTEDVPLSQRKRLTRPGRYALALVIGSGAASLAATVAKDVTDSRKETEAAQERQKQIQEIRLLSVTFEKIEIRLQLDEAMSWRDVPFLSEAAQEEIYGGWVHFGVPNGIYANWCLSKSLNQINSRGEKNVDALFIETRRDKIAELIDQNYPALNNSLPPQLALKGNLDSIKNYHSPNVLYFGSSYNDPASGIRFDVPDPLAELKYGTEKFDEIVFAITTRISFAQIMGNDVRLGMTVVTSDVTNDGPSMWTRRPAHTPFLLQHLTAVDVYLDGRLLKHVFDRKHDELKFAATSQWDQEHNNFSTEIFKITLDHDLIAVSQAAPP
jgi:hypothetical protein